MIESTEQSGPTSSALIREKLAACWWQLLAVELLFAGAGWATLTLCTTSIGPDLLPVRNALFFGASGLGFAWSWSAKLRILDGGHGFLSALRPDLRRIGWLAGWLLALDVIGLLGFLSFVDIDAYADFVFSPAMPAVLLGALYLKFAAALLPMAILLEGRGVRRAWRLTHRHWRTVLRVLPVVVLGRVASDIVHRWLVTAAFQYSPQPSYPLVQAGALLAGALLDTLTAVLLYTAYRLSPSVTADAGPEPARLPATVPSAA
ncbi:MULTISPECIES: hypothetical protein [unclassified Kitasatospora]|uniref:hypothetical protein n=1 Tax=unclassified Kitasatospora TaxID=2633591 RepID=UPI00070BCCD9|nr:MULTISPECIES: hypothetical protein [unclassified Kitasatospora]KQV13944.1 hypothetical protein ASC99_32395 [Kitasatospora sp. Root107]KRB68932.1 hypothetical protein ASE03_28980 [Kitasatospora sp. Root187]